MKAERVLRSISGFRWGGIKIGLKDETLDFGCLSADRVCRAAAVFTRNNFPGAPIVVGREHIANGRLQAIVVNSKNANVATGLQGIEAARNMARWMGESLNVRAEDVLPSSTGVIGRPLDTKKIQEGCRQIVPQMGEDAAHIEAFARAIMTTDHHPKWASLQVGDATLMGVAKGAGMVEPNMATMLAYIVTDAAVPAERLPSLLREAVDASFNRISIDTDTSTSDTAVVLANGEKNVDEQQFSEALQAVCLDLAQQIARDGEGATKLIELTISGAPNREVALKFGKAVINSPLVKTAIYGADPNWGRLVMAIGKVFEHPVQLADLKIWFGSDAEGRLCMDTSSANDASLLELLRERLRREHVFLEISVGAGPARETVWGCDLSEGYIVENAYYTT